MSARKLPLLRGALLLCIALLLFVIFAHSSDDGAASGGKSAAVTAFLNGLLERTGAAFRFTEHLVRKGAHFCEYALLGCLLTLLGATWTLRLRFISWPLLGGLFTALCDELFQLTVPGRAGQVQDVALDFAGVVAGATFAVLLLLLLLRARKSAAQKQPSCPTDANPL